MQAAEYLNQMRSKKLRKNVKMQGLLDLVGKNLILFDESDHLLYAIQLVTQLCFLARIVGTDFFQLFLAERRVQVKAEHDIIQSGLPPCLDIRQSSVFALYHSFYILTSIIGISGIAFCISESSSRLSKV